MLIVGLTGGIGSGKSTVARLFSELGVPIIDTDQIARDVVKPGSDALKQIIQKFGPAIAQNDGELDRSAMRQLIFENPELRIWLEQLLHPLIRAQVARRIDQVQHPYCIIVIPLLAETAPNPLVQRVLVVDCSEQDQLQRASKRDNSSIEQIQQVIKNQATREERLAIANEVITNDGDLEHLTQQVLKLDEIYKKVSSSPAR